MQPTTIPANFDGLLAWSRYLYWSELMRRDWFSYMEKHGDKQEVGHAEWLGTLCYWGASTYVVIEGWEAAKFEDPIVEALLKLSDYKDQLRRMRNGTFHYQPTLLSPKLVGLFRSMEAGLWLVTLHEEFCRWTRDFVEAVERKELLSYDKTQEWRDTFSKLTGWLPLRPGEEQLEALRKTFDEAEAKLDASDSNSEAAQNLRGTLRSYGTLVRDTAERVRGYRRECLTRVGLNPDDYIP